MARASQSAPAVRRSQRIREKAGHGGNDEYDLITESSSSSISKQERIGRNNRTVDNSIDCLEGPSTVVKRKPRLTADQQRLSSRELIIREQTLLDKEQEYKDRLNALEERIRSLNEKEDRVSVIMTQTAKREMEGLLQQLEDYFICALCYEVLAAPYSLNPANCGHTFCALCILKWFFSRLHRACGGWHESVDCPICRSLLIITPELPPRLHFTFPFVPNRVAASLIEHSIEELAKLPLCSQTQLKEEEIEGEWTQKKDHGNTCNRKKEKSEAEEEDASEKPDLAAWREGGLIRAEWLKRDRDGRKQMAYLSKHWTAMRSQDFVAMKQLLGV